MPLSDGKPLARWQATLDGVTTCSPLTFYQMVAEEILKRELPNVTFSQITRNEGGWFSARRIYLRIREGKLFFDLCAFPAGNSFVVSYWLHEASPGVIDLFAELPVIGFLIERTAQASTYFSVDYIEHFQRSIHKAVLTVVDRLTAEAGRARLPEEDRQPVWTEFYE